MGHGPAIQKLLLQLARYCADSVTRVVLTRNVPEDRPVPPQDGWPFVLQLIDNPEPLGFGANHNLALAGASEPFLCVLNPDVDLAGANPFPALVEAVGRSGAGCAYPLQVDEHGHLEDSERELPTPAALLRRRVLRQPDNRVDWVNAACMVVPRPVWLDLGGFDPTYFMYCEDVDLCLRMRLAGLALVRGPAEVVHAGYRASHRRWSHLRWHVLSLLRLWRSPTYHRARPLLATGRG
jgi:N-acetylglucosaminyl-diphospho-decaprenol L-rhamnosyltransferase